MAKSKQSGAIPSVTAVVTETWTNLTGEPVTAEEVLAEFGRLPREGVTRSILLLNALVGSADLATLAEADRHLREICFPARLRPLLKSAYIDGSLSPRTVVFHRRQMLAAFLLAQRACLEGDGLVQWERIGPLLLKVSALFEQEHQPHFDHRLGLAAFLLPHFYDSNPPDHNLGLMRGVELVRLGAWASQAKLRQAREIFEERTGLRLADFYKVLLPLHHRVATVASLDKTPVIRPQRIFESAPQGEAIRRTLDFLSVSYEEYPRRVPSTSDVLQDRQYELIRSQPLLRLPDGAYACVDPSALGGRSAENLHWTLRRLLPQAEGQEYFADWGVLIEEYVNTNLISLLGAGFQPNPRDQSGREITDGLLDAGEDAVVVEVKTATLNDREVRYANDPVALAAALEGKYLRDSQLGDALERLFGPEQLGRAFCSHLAQRPPRPIRRAWPLMVVTDRALNMPDIEQYLAEQVASALPSTLPRSLQIMPLQVLFLDDLQRMFPLLRRRHKLVNLLKERHRLRRSSATTFHNFLIPVYERAGLTLPFENAELETVFNSGVEFWRAQGSELGW